MEIIAEMLIHRLFAKVFNAIVFVPADHSTIQAGASDFFIIIGDIGTISAHKGNANLCRMVDVAIYVNSFQ